MEVFTLAGLVGLGYIVSRATEKREQPIVKQKVAAKPSQVPVRPMMADGFAQARTPVAEGFQSQAKLAPTQNPWSELDMMYMTGDSNTLPTEPNPSSTRGFPTQYATGMASAAPQPIGSSRPLVEMRTDGIEEKPTYLDGDYMMSTLTGQRIATPEFTHNNMVPFYGGRMKQNVNVDAGNSRLDTYTGTASLQIAKREVEPLFDTATTPFGNPNGFESSTDFMQGRIELTRNRGGERPFEPTRVAAGIGEQGGVTGKGGFQQMEVNDVMRAAMKTDELRVANNPKQSYNSVIVPGKHFVGGAADSAGEVRKYRPDAFYENNDGERFFVTNGEVIKESVRPIQILNYTTRPETSQEYTGVAVAQDAHTSYITGSYKNPSAQQFAPDGFHNADLTGYRTANTDGANADYGRRAIENRPNERTATGDRVMGLNLAPAEAGANIIHYMDEIRPTRRAETIGNLRQAGMPVGYAAGAPAVTVWDPSDVARTTVKEGTLLSNYLGQASSASAPSRLKVYDPDDIARPTQKAQLSAKDYYGAPMSANQAQISHEAAGRTRLNEAKQKVAARRAPIAGNGGNMNLLGGSEMVNQRSRKLQADSINDHEAIKTRVSESGVNQSELGRVKYRVPLATQDRAEGAILGQLDSNPYSMSLFQVAAEGGA
jgi:hypothetical protein